MLRFVAVGLCMIMMILQSISGEKPFMTMNCPEKFKIGEVNNINCTSQASSVEIAEYCANKPSTVSFLVTRVGSQAQATLCTNSYPSQQSDCTEIGKNGCGCTGVNGTTNSYMFKYVGDQQDKGAIMNCSVCGLMKPTENNCIVDFDGAGGLTPGGLVVALSSVLAVALINWM